MRKNVMKAGLLALTAALVMISCADPNADKDSGNKSPTIIRLYLDRGKETNLIQGNAFTLTVGQEILTPVGYNGSTYPYTRNDILTTGVDKKTAVYKGNSYGDSSRNADLPYRYWSTGAANYDPKNKNWEANYTDKGKHREYRNGPFNPASLTDPDQDVEYIPDTTFQKDRTKALMIKPSEAASGTNSEIALGTLPAYASTDVLPSVINRANYKKKVLWSGVVFLQNYPTDPMETANMPQGMIEVTTDNQYFVDIFLYDATLNGTDPLTLFTGSMKAYIELEVLGPNTVDVNNVPLVPSNLSFTSAAGTTVTGADAAIGQGKFYYTPKKNGFNDPWKVDKVDQVTYFKTDNANIKAVSLKPGINELRLSHFTNTQFQDLLTTN